jgi:hypothetical protein
MASSTRSPSAQRVCTSRPRASEKGHELSWKDLASGDAELNRDLVRSLTKQPKGEQR